MHYCRLFSLYKIQIKTLLAEAQKPWKGFLVLQTGIHRGSFLLRWFKPSGLGIPCIENREFKFEECACLARQAEHMLIWKTEQETELNLAERAALLRQGKRLWRRLKPSTCWRNAHKLCVEDTLLSTVSLLFLSKTCESIKWNQTQICQHERPLVHELLTHGTENLEESRARFVSWQPDATVHSPPMGCQMDTYFHGGYLAINWSQAVAEWMWGRVVLSPACTLLFPLSEAGTQQSAKKSIRKDSSCVLPCLGRTDNVKNLNP